MGKLEERRKAYEIPEQPYLPLGKTVLVFRIPNQTKTAGGLWVPDAHTEPQPVGVLIGAGASAMDILDDGLIEIGDIVWFGRFAGWEKEVSRIAEGKGVKILQMKVEDILGSVDALARLKTHKLDRNEDGQHMYVKTGGKK